MMLFANVFFTKRTDDGFAIVTVYVDDLNLIGTPKSLSKVLRI